MPAFSVSVESAVDDGMVTVHVAGTVADATSAGLFHPSCRHSLSAYLPGATKVPTHTADPQGDAARQRLRDLERRVRKQKLLADAAIDPAAGKEHSAKAAAYEKQIAVHVKETRDLGIKRKPDREKPDLGFSAAPPGTVTPSAARKPKPEPPIPAPAKPRTAPEPGRELPLKREEALLSAPLELRAPRTLHDANERRLFGAAAEAWPAPTRKAVQRSLQSYEAGGYYNINTYLRLDPADAATRRQYQILRRYGIKDVKNIDRAMAASPLPHAVETFRGIKNPRIVFGSAWSESSSNVGLQWIEDSFASSTVSEGVARNFASGNDGVVMRLIAPKGVGAIKLADMNSEAELMLERGLAFRIAADHGVVDGRRMIDVEIVGKNAKELA